MPKSQSFSPWSLQGRSPFDSLVSLDFTLGAGHGSKHILERTLPLAYSDVNLIKDMLEMHTKAGLG
jgi:hypothetical protein